MEDLLEPEDFKAFKYLASYVYIRMSVHNFCIAILIISLPL